MANVFAGQYLQVADNTNSQLLKSTPFTVYLAGTTTLATLYTDRTMATGAPNPSVTDNRGNLQFFAAPGRYDVLCNGSTQTVTVYPDPADIAQTGTFVPQGAGTSATQDVHFDSGVPWFDVVGKGADPTGSADSTTAIQNALNAVPATGGIVYFPPGVYKVSATLFPKSNTKLWGVWGGKLDGSAVPQVGSCLLWVGAAGGTCLSYFDVEFVSTDGLTIIYGNAGANTGTGVVVDSNNTPATHNIDFAHLEIIGFHTSFQNGTSVANGYQCDTVNVRQSRFESDGTTGSIGARFQSDNAFDGGVFDTVTFVGFDYSIWIDAIGFCVFRNCLDGGLVNGGNGTAMFYIPGRHNAFTIESCETENRNGFLTIPNTAAATQSNPITLIGNTINAPITIAAQQRIVSIGNNFATNVTATMSAAGCRVTSIGDAFTSGTTGWQQPAAGSGIDVLVLTPGGAGNPLLTFTSASSNGVVVQIQPNLANTQNPVALGLDGTIVGGHYWSFLLPGSSGGFQPAKNLVIRDGTAGNNPLMLHDNGVQIGGGATVYSGSGAPNIAASIAADVYHRTDTPGTANQRYYIATAANTWSGIL